jgi:hypothetical protein
MHSCFVFFILDEVKEERTVKERDVGWDPVETLL